MSRYVILHGVNSIPGRAGVNYEIFDVIDITNSKDLEEDMRQYVIGKYIEQGKSLEKIEEDLFCRRRNIILHDGKTLAERTKVFDNCMTNEFFCFLPVESFNNSLFNNKM